MRWKNVNLNVINIVWNHLWSNRHGLFRLWEEKCKSSLFVLRNHIDSISILYGKCCRSPCIYSRCHSLFLPFHYIKNILRLEYIKTPCTKTCFIHGAYPQKHYQYSLSPTISIFISSSIPIPP